MKHLSLGKRIIAILCTLIMCISCMGITAFAVDESLSKDDSKKFESIESASEIGLSVGDSGTLTVNDKLSDKTESEQKKAMQNFVADLNSAGISQEGKNAITNALKDGYKDVAGVEIDVLIITYLFDQTQGDLIGAMGVVSPFLPLINLVIGVVAIVVLAFLVLSSVIDLAFIGLPMVREAMMAGDGNGQGGGSGSKPKALTYACWSTINEVEGALGGGGSGGTSGGKSGYKNAYGLYFKKRMWDYVLLGVCLSFLIFGGFSRLISGLLGIGKQLVG